MKTMITPLAIGALAFLTLATGCQKKAELNEKTGYEQFVVEGENQPITLEVAHDQENIYLRVAEAELGSGAVTHFTVVPFDCDSFRTAWQEDPSAFSFRWNITVGHDTTWSVMPTTGSSTCMCILSAAGNEEIPNRPREEATTNTNGDLASQQNGSLLNPIRYCLN